MTLAIFGSGSVAEIAAQYFEDDYKMPPEVCIVDDEFATASKTTFGIPLLSLTDFFKEYKRSKNDVKVFVAISYSNLNTIRTAKCRQIIDAGFSLTSYISPRATILTKYPIGMNAFIFEDNTVQPFVRIGNFVTLWSGNHIGHHSSVGDGVFISSHVVLSGNCEVGEESFLGVNSTIGDSVRIGKGSVVGAGAVVTKTCSDFSVIVPARSTTLDKDSRTIGL